MTLPQESLTSKFNHIQGASEMGGAKYMFEQRKAVLVQFCLILADSVSQELHM